MCRVETSITREIAVVRVRSVFVQGVFFASCALIMCACTDNRELECDPQSSPSNDAVRKEKDAISFEAGTYQGVGHGGEWGFGEGVEVPNGSSVVVAQFSALNHSTNSGHIIVEGLLNRRIVPLVCGSRALNVRVATARATEARKIIRSLIKKHSLEGICPF